jgi:hypothetical protein
MQADLLSSYRAARVTKTVVLGFLSVCVRMYRWQCQQCQLTYLVQLGCSQVVLAGRIPLSSERCLHRASRVVSREEVNLGSDLS